MQLHSMIFSKKNVKLSKFSLKDADENIVYNVAVILSRELLVNSLRPKESYMGW